LLVADGSSDSSFANAGKIRAGGELGGGRLRSCEGGFLAPLVGLEEDVRRVDFLGRHVLLAARKIELAGASEVALRRCGSNSARASASTLFDHLCRSIAIGLERDPALDQRVAIHP
jgi:hypothetical protein